MKSYLAVILASGLVCGGWALGKGAKRTTNEPRFRSRELTHWAHTLTADQTRSTNVLFEIGPSIVPYLVLEIERYQLCRPDYSFALHSFVFSYAPRGIRKFIPAPINQEERRFNAIILLGKMGPAAKQAVPALIRLLDDEKLEATGAVALALGKIGPDAKDAVPKLIELLDDPSAEVATTLGEIGPDASAAIPALIRVSTTGPLVLRRAAQEAMMRIDPLHFLNPSASFGAAHKGR